MNGSSGEVLTKAVAEREMIGDIKAVLTASISNVSTPMPLLESIRRLTFSRSGA